MSIWLAIGFAYKKKIKSCGFYYYAWHGLTACGLGLAIASLQHPHQDHHLSVPIKNQTIKGTIEDIEQRPKKGLRLMLSMLCQSQSSIPCLRRVKLRAGTKTIEGLQPGDTVRCDVTLLPLSAPVSPLNYDFRTTYKYQMIDAVGRIHHCFFESRPLWSLARVRHGITQKLRQQIRSPYGDLAAALLTGDRSGIDDTIRQNFADSGLAHILAISGLHMALIASLIFFLMCRGLVLLLLIPGRLRTWLEQRSLHPVAAIITLLLCASYLGISGIGIPALRAYIMIAVVMVALIFYRNPFTMRSVGIAASFILIVSPFSLFTASFQLSFTAVIALVAGYEAMSKWFVYQKFMRGKGILKSLLIYVLGLVSSTVIATLATMPLSAAIFNRITLQALVGNIIALPLTAFWIMPTIMAVGVCMLMNIEAALIWTFLEKGLAYLTHIAQWVSQLPGACIRIHAPHPMFYGLFSVGGVMLVIGPIRVVRYVGGLLFAIAIISFFRSEHLPCLFVAGDRSVIALHEPPLMYVSTLTRGQFYVDQWRQILGIAPENVRIFPQQDWKWRNWYVIADPFKNQVSPWLQDYKKYKTYLKSMRFLIGYYRIPVVTNAFLHHRHVMINGDQLLKRGTAVVYSNQRVHFME